MGFKADSCHHRDGNPMAVVQTEHRENVPNFHQRQMSEYTSQQGADMKKLVSLLWEMGGVEHGLWDS
jgi:hypothetical protein